MCGPVGATPWWCSCCETTAASGAVTWRLRGPTHGARSDHTVTVVGGGPPAEPHARLDLRLSPNSFRAEKSRRSLGRVRKPGALQPDQCRPQDPAQHVPLQSSHLVHTNLQIFKHRWFEHCWQNCLNIHTKTTFYVLNTGVNTLFVLNYHLKTASLCERMAFGRASSSSGAGARTHFRASALRLVRTMIQIAVSTCVVISTRNCFKGNFGI